MSVLRSPTVRVAVEDNLAGLPAGVGKTEAVGDVVQAGLQLADEVLAGGLGLLEGLVDILPELGFHDAVHIAGLLFFAKLNAVVGDAASSHGAVAGEGAAPVDGALGCVAPFTFKEKLFAHSAAEPAGRACIILPTFILSCFFLLGFPLRGGGRVWNPPYEWLVVPQAFTATPFFSWGVCSRCGGWG